MTDAYTISATTLRLLLALSFLLLVLVAWRELGRVQRAVGNGYNWIDLLMEDGKTSKSAHVMLGAFITTTWFFVYYAIAGKMTEAYYAIYAASWIAPVVARLIWNPNTAVGGQAAQTTTTTTTETK